MDWLFLPGKTDIEEQKNLDVLFQQFFKENPSVQDFYDPLAANYSINLIITLFFEWLKMQPEKTKGMNYDISKLSPLSHAEQVHRSEETA